MKKFIRFTALFSILVVIFFGLQFIQVFPGVIRSATFDSSLKSRPLPTGVESKMVTTSDGVEIELWRKAPQLTTGGLPRGIVLIFHGNGDTLFSAFRAQEWLSELGFTAYAAEYRGYGRSGGWPSESGLYLDAEAAVAQVMEREKVAASVLTLLGFSLGSAPASYLASKLQPKALVLLAPLSNIQSVLKLNPILKHVRGGIRLYNFPVNEFVSKLTSTCLVVASGGEDRVLPSSQAEEVIESFKGAAPVQRVRSELAGHNDLLARTKPQLADAIFKCLGAPKAP